MNTRKLNATGEIVKLATQTHEAVRSTGAVSTSTIAKLGAALDAYFAAGDEEELPAPKGSFAEHREAWTHFAAVAFEHQLRIATSHHDEGRKATAERAALWADLMTNEWKKRGFGFT